jgi:CMP-N,N'-diacetyllegionaminic acid synthase
MHLNAKDLLIVIPARGGSKGIPRKNIKLLGGRPLVDWSRAAVKSAGLQSARCILSTDDEEVAEVGHMCGFEVPFRRPVEIAADESTMVDVALHALDWSEAQGFNVEIVLMLLPTHPFRLPRQLAAALNVFSDPDVDGVMSVMAIHRSLSTLFYGNNKFEMSPLGERVRTERRQDVRPIYTPSGCFFFARAAALRNQETFYTRNVIGIETDPVASMDLDTPTEWAMAEAIAMAGLTWRGVGPYE